MGRIFAFAVLATIISGCASTGTIRTEQPLSRGLASYRTLSVQTYSMIPGAKEEVLQVEAAVIGYLQDAELFDEVFSQRDFPDAKSDLQLTAEITWLKRVSGGDRFWLGALAGRAMISVDVEFIETSSGNVIGAFVADGKSSGGTAFAGTTQEAIDRVIEKIDEFIEVNM